MKRVLWTLVLSLVVTACLTNCGDSSSDSSYEVPSYKREAALPDSCTMEVARVYTAYYACFDNEWVEVTDSAFVEQLRGGLDEDEVRAMLEELEDQLAKGSSSSKKPASSSEAAEELDDDDEGDVEESSSSSEERSRRRARNSSSSAKKKQSDSEENSEESSSSSVKSSSSSAVSSSSSVESSSSSAKSSSSSVGEIVDCAGKTYQSGNHNMSVTVDGKKRTFIMHVPSSYKGDEPVPLVVDYHPIGGSGQGQLNGTTYKSQTDPEGVISLYPDGTSKPGGMGPGWNVGPCCSDDDDVKFSREMIAAVEEIACIDKKRVYAAGFSMGGGMANHVACFMSDVFAAVAPAAMDLNTTNSAKCNPERPISIIMFRGTADNVCKYQGGDSGYGDGLNFLGAERNFRFWAEKNGCTGSPTKNSDGCDEYSNCKDGTKVVLCTKQGGGHEQGDANIGWPFLQQFTLP